VPTRSELLDRELRRAVRQVAHRSGGATGRGWTELAGLGTFSAALPVEAGGLHLGLVVAAALCEELGGELADPLLLDTMTAADLLAADAERHRPLLDLVLAGRRRLALALHGDPTAKSTVDGWLVDGVIPFVTGADRADAILLAARTGERSGVYLVPGDRPGCRAEPDRGAPTAALCVLRLDGLRLHPVDELNEPVPERARARARIRRAAYLVGLATAAHALTVRHVRQRRQFDRPLADNQAVAFPLAELAIRIEAARRCVRHAAGLDDDGRSGELPGVGAAAMAAELALDTTRIGIHLHGAFGMTEAASISRFYRHAAAESLRDGGPTRLWREAGRLRLAAARR